MLNVGQVTKRYAISRASLLHYEQVGLLKPIRDANNDYRRYDAAQIERLEKILAYRAYGLSLAKIKIVLEGSLSVQKAILSEQFYALDIEIKRLRHQQQAIVHGLQSNELLENDMLTKERWVEIMRAAGFSEQDMMNWHKQFETMEPEAHQDFLESLQIDASEIDKIRKRSQA